MRIEFGLAGDKQIARELIGVGQRSLDARPAFGAIATRLVGWEVEQFDTQGAAGGGERWKPLKPSTVAAKARRHLDPRILHAHGDLRASLTDIGDEHMVREVGRSFLRFGTDIDYAMVHQRPKDSNQLPQRRPLELRMTQRGVVVDDLQLWIKRGIARTATDYRGLL